MSSPPFIPVNNDKSDPYSETDEHSAGYVELKQEEIWFRSGIDGPQPILDGSSLWDLDDLFDETSHKEELNVDKVLPEGLRAGTQKIREFLREYYKFLQSSDGNGSWIINNEIKKSRDLDKADEHNSLKKIFFELAKEYRNTDLFIDDRSFLKNVIEYFSHKGNTNAFKNLLKVLLKDFSTEVSEPWDQVLHTSMGDWTQEKYITVRFTDEMKPLENLREVRFFSIFRDNEEHKNILIHNPSFIEVSRVEKLDSTYYRLYTFETISENFIRVGQGIRVLDGNRETFFEGEVAKSINGVDVIEGGKFWQRGQIIIFPGTHKESILRVERVHKKNNVLDMVPTSIRTVEIISPGYFHNDGDEITVSPFDYSPALSDFVVTYGVQKTPPYGRDINIGIRDYSVYTEEYVFGQGRGTYFSQVYDYTIDRSSYNGQIEFAIQNLKEVKDESLDTSISQEDWLASLARLRMRFGSIGYLPGYWKTDRSRLSNDTTRLQDNFFFQIFSYVISSVNNPELYKDYALLFHPAGLKRFLEYRQEQFIDAFFSLEDIFEFILDLIDLAGTDDHQFNDFTKVILDPIFPIDNQPFCWDDGSYDLTLGYDTYSSTDPGHPNSWDTIDKYDNGGGSYDVCFPNGKQNFELIKKYSDEIILKEEDINFDEDMSARYAVPSWSTPSDPLSSKNRYNRYVATLRMN